MKNRKTLILGGMRSGKSRWAERLAIQSHFPVTYVTTAVIEDPDMQSRISLHRANQPGNWKVVEEPLQLARTLAHLASETHCLLIDNLTYWLVNLLKQQDDAVFEQEFSALLSILPTLSGRIILVANEMGMGFLNMDTLTHRYCDEAGKLHQLVARQCEQVILTVAGLPHYLKGAPDR